MPRFTWHASHEQFAPDHLLNLAKEAEEAGFDGVFSSDHLQPWSPTQGHSGFLWAWLGAALGRTALVSLAAITIPGGWRYHPVVTAHAIATAAAMFPGRIPWIALGSGEALNESMLGLPWPDKAERDARLREGFEIVRRLLRGETVEHHGVLDATGARLWTLPDTPPALIGAALSAGTAEWLGSVADGLLTAGVEVDALHPIVEAFRRGGGTRKPMHLKVDVSYGTSTDEALRNAHREWRFVAVDAAKKETLRTPQEFFREAATVTPQELGRKVIVFNRAENLIARLRRLAALGFETIDLHNVGPNQSEFIAMAGRQILPELR